MEVIRKKIVEVIQEKYNGDFSLEDLVNFCFDTGIVDFRRAEISLVKKHYRELLRANPGMKVKEAKEKTADKFCISESKVENCMYYYKGIEI